MRKGATVDHRQPVHRRQDAEPATPLVGALATTGAAVEFGPAWTEWDCEVIGAPSALALGGTLRCRFKSHTVVVAKGCDKVSALDSRHQLQWFHSSWPRSANLHVTKRGRRFSMNWSPNLHVMKRGGCRGVRGSRGSAVSQRPKYLPQQYHHVEIRRRPTAVTSPSNIITWRFGEGRPQPDPHRSRTLTPAKPQRSRTVPAAATVAHNRIPRITDCAAATSLPASSTTARLDAPACGDASDPHRQLRPRLDGPQTSRRTARTSIPLTN